MGLVIANMSVSLDGFMAGPNDSSEQPMGEGGMRLFNWYSSGSVEFPMQDGRMVLRVSSESAQVLEEAFRTTGAMVAGRKMFDFAGAWEGHPPFVPCFIVTHSPPPEWTEDGSPFTFVTDGIESAIRQAKQAAGDKNVAVATAATTQQAIKAGLLDEIQLDLVPVLLGGGVRVFDNLGPHPIELEAIRVVEAPGVTHLRYRVIK